MQHKECAPYLQMQAFLEATDRALRPSREIYAAFAATERMLKPSRELQELAVQSEKLARSFAQHGAASFDVLDKAMQQSESFKAMIAVMDAHSSSASLKSILDGFEKLKNISPFRAAVVNGSFQTPDTDRRLRWSRYTFRFQ